MADWMRRRSFRSGLVRRSGIYLKQKANNNVRMSECVSLNNPPRSLSLSSLNDTAISQETTAGWSDCESEGGEKMDNTPQDWTVKEW